MLMVKCTRLMHREGKNTGDNMGAVGTHTGDGGGKYRSEDYM